jgi:fatty-acyl-CoA synthase
VSLPAYARPVFLRMQGEVDTTGTLKYRKVELVAAGFDPMNTRDPLFVIDHEAKSYTPITPDIHRAIVAGGVRV